MPTPSTLVLDARAEYYPDGDTVLVSVYVIDPTENVGFPGLVQEGTCTLIHRETAVKSISFDRRFGNGEGADGDFIFQFSHPSVTSNLRVAVEVVAPYGAVAGILKKTVPVTKAGTEYIPLQPTPVTNPDANAELRSNARIKELI